MPNDVNVCEDCHLSCLTCKRPNEETACLTCKKTSEFVLKNEGE